MISKVVGCFIGIASVLTIGLGAYTYSISRKIAFVRSHDLVTNYKGTKEAIKSLHLKKEQWQANIDTLQSDLQNSINKYTEESKKMNVVQKREMEKFLLSKRNEFDKYSAAIAQKTQEEDDQSMQRVLNQVNTYVEEYAKSKGYDMIFGTTVSGNVMYGDAQLDITNDVLTGLNRKYEGK